MTRVLHLYSGNLYGGIEAMLATLARERWRSPGMEPHFALSFPGRLAAELEAAGAPVHMLGEVRASRPLSVLRARRRLRALLRRTAFHAAICHAPWSQAVFGPVVRGAGVPLVLFLHNPAEGRHWTERLARRSRPALVISNSGFTAASVPRLYAGVPGAVLHPPVPEPDGAGESREAVRAALHVAPGEVVVTQVARLEPWKGQERLLEALGTLAGLGGWVCWIVGGAQRPHEEAYLARLRRRAGELGIAQRVRFLGERRDVPSLLRGSDLFCHPAATPEPFGIGVVEALYAGLAVIVAEGGGPAEIVDSACGVQLPSHDTAALARELRRLIVDPGARRELGERAPARARAVSHPETQLPRLLQLVHRAARSAAP